MKKIDKKLLIIIVLFIITFLMVTSLASFAQFVAGKKPAENYNVNWNVSFVDYKVIEERSAKIESVVYTPSTVYMETNLSPSGIVSLEFKIQNKGNLSAKVKDVYLLPESSSDDLVVKEISGIEKEEVLKPGEEKVIVITVKYNDKGNSLKQKYSSQFIIDYVQA